MTPKDTSSAGDSTSGELGEEPYEVRYDPASDTPITSAVTEAVAAVTGTDPRELRPLYEVVEPDALERILGPRSATGAETTCDCRVVFSYEGCSVHIGSDGRVVVRPSEDG
ncbi:hypothetical protein M0R88_11435 [Halorussus gelatinilyticus]|uniref:Halobacterial output domain-containing protein n=1 Tax=Halorussus gelatinilyticus TaxID=2937524 RepID=A0A8U0IGF3_9EURY|nr:HalOD1 output domain-containing protein [Halorussus gelatinilyticus]UPV99138.1 hypothetical protein M0R88_11435 [Halorussus gelatinilyticus]